VALSFGRTKVADIRPGLYEEGWRGAGLGRGEASAADPELHVAKIRAPGGALVQVETRASAVEGGVRLRYKLTPRSRVVLNSLNVSMEFPISVVAGRRFVADDEEGEVPAEFGDVHLRSARMKSLRLGLRDAPPVALRFAAPTQALLQDNRRWGPTFVVRIGTSGDAEVWEAGRSLEIAFDLTSEGDMQVEHDTPVTIAEGPEWIPLRTELDIVPGSALDFSKMGLQDAPAGKHGRVVARPDGTFAFKRKPDEPVRFYGVNLCFSAHYITHEQSDRLAERLVRLGYNALRFHHYEGELVAGGSGVGSIPLAAEPTETSDLTSFKAPGGEGERYGARVRGFVHPPATGEYTFRVASDDDSDLYLSTDAGPARKKRIAHVRGWTGIGEWDKYPSQTSAPIRLVAGKRYYVEALHKQGVGGDHLEVAWRGPGGVDGVIAGEHLSSYPSGASGKVAREVWRDGAAATSTEPAPAKLDQLDYLLAALKNRGIYVTTDLFVSRPVRAAEIWPGAEGDVGMDNFKALCLVNDMALENWKAFTRNLLAHRNPYTGMTWAEDPAVGWLSMINEGNPGNRFGEMPERVEADWRAAWNRWLAKTYATRAGVARAWGRDPGGDPREGTVPFFKNTYSDSPRGRDFAVFCAETERAMFVKMRDFLREEIGTKALLTNMNAWTNRLAYQVARTEYDYVDDHFYVDHPEWIERPWQLPSRCPNTSPVAGGAGGGRSRAFTRLLDKPFTISEYNYSGPGRFRGVGGIITGAMGALQGWGAIWRFTYAHSREAMFTPSPANYFDMVTDPLNQAAERASVCLYLRGDMKPARRTVAVAATPKELMEIRRRNHPLAPGWHALALVSRVGTFIAPKPGEVPADLTLALGWGAPKDSWRGGETLEVDPYAAGAGGKILKAMRRKGWLEGNRTDLGRNIIESETGEFLIDAPRDVMVLDTPKTAGCYAPEGETVEAGPVRVTITKQDATVWVSSVDGRPIAESRRLIITHLTDLQNSGARFGERARQTLHEWGGMPHLVRAGAATVTIRLAGASRAKVHGLSTSGRRTGEVEATVRAGELVVPLDIEGPEGARMIYEVEVR
jgi:hypothetical protein